MILRRALGEKHPSPKILRAIEAIGSGFIETPSLIIGSYYFEFFDAGVSFNFENDELIQISFYLKPNGTYKEFKDDLFDGVLLSNLDYDFVVSTYGKPFSIGGGEKSMLGYINKWIKYRFNDFYINFEFEDNGKIVAIHLLSLS